MRRDKNVYMTAAEVRRADKGRFAPPNHPIAFAYTALPPDPPVLVLTYPCLPPSKNEYMRLHWRSQQERFFTPWEQWCAWEFQYRAEPKSPVFKGAVSVRIQFYFPDNRRKDQMNYSSFPPLMDVLVRAGIIEDDSHQMCAITVLPPTVDGTARTVITIRNKEA